LGPISGPLTMIIPPAPPRPFNVAKLLVIVVALVGTGLFISLSRRQPPTSAKPTSQQQWQMPELIGQTQDALIGRFGAPLSTKDYPLSEGSFAGPEIGLKHYYLFKSPAYAARLKGAPTRWSYPQYTTIRELIWQLPDSFLTVWLDEPHGSADLNGDSIEITLPKAPPGAWVALDDYRVGKDLLAKRPR
jgi:hypothetical protein